MNTEMTKGKALSRDETLALLKLIEGSKIIACQRKTNATNNKLKTEEWIRLTKRFNATFATCPRTPQQLRLKWENLKKNARKRNKRKTGGGALDDILERVSSILDSRRVGGFTDLFGGDKELMFLDVGDIKGGGDDSVTGNDDGSVTGNGVISGSCVNSDDCDFTGTTSTLNRNDDNHYGLSSVPFNKPRTVKKRKIVTDDSRRIRNRAIAEYYSAKKKCLDANLSNIILQNENVKLQNDNLKLRNAKLRLELQHYKSSR